MLNGMLGSRFPSLSSKIRVDLRMVSRTLCAQSAGRNRRVAVLVDADNVPARLCGAILEEVATRVNGETVDQRVYGDFSLPRLTDWKMAALTFGFETKMQASPAKSKNATDIALCIDVMDILHRSDPPVDTFVIVTNDGDFAPLAQRLRRSGRRVVAVGTGSTLVASCDEHVHVDFSRVPLPSHHTPDDVNVLVEMIDEAANAANSSSSTEGRLSDSDFVSISQLAGHIDRKKPGWRRSRVADFVNFRHMLETEPYCDVIEFRHNRSGRTPAKGGSRSMFSVRLRPKARAELAMRRADEEDEQAAVASRTSDDGSGAIVAGSDVSGASGTGDTEPSVLRRLSSWIWGSRATEQPQAGVTPPAHGLSSFTSAEDAQFVIGLIDPTKIAENSLVSQRHEPGGQYAPEGEGWVHFAELQRAIDREAEATGRDKGWRIRYSKSHGGFRPMLTGPEFQELVEVCPVRSGPTTIDWWARKRIAT